MKTIRLALIILAGALITFGLGGTALAFHDGGVAHCDGCHTMHNSQDGVPVTDTQGGYLMLRSDGSSTCLRCHAGYGQKTDNGSGYGAGGDYYWLTKNFTWTAHGHAASSPGESHGHNIIAADFGLTTVDSMLAFSPGGNYSAGNLGCNSCHDPHGEGGNARLLRGAGPAYPEGYSFGFAAPILEGTSRRTVIGESGEVADDNHTAYQSDMSQWCGNCHWDVTNPASYGDKHPADRPLGSTIATTYNGYISTDIPTGGNQETAFWEIAPFEDPANTTSSTAGPTGSSKVMCLTCHRAHASAFPNIGRWYFAATFMNEDSHPQLGDGDATADDVTNSYYGRIFDDSQRSLCNKCHVQD